MSSHQLQCDEIRLRQRERNVLPALEPFVISTEEIAELNGVSRVAEPQTSRHGFASVDEFEAALRGVQLYSPSGTSFFTWTYAIMNRSCKRRDTREAKIVWNDLDILDDDGWQFPTWHPRMRDEMIPALKYLYNTIDDGVNWAALCTVKDP